jgi:hypothetical protein
MLRRLKNLWKLSAASPEKIQAAIDDGDIFLAEPEGEFMPDMTEEEYQQYLSDEVGGWKKFKQRFGL